MDDTLGGGAINDRNRCGQSFSGGGGVFGGSCFPDPFDERFEGRLDMCVSLVSLPILLDPLDGRLMICQNCTSMYG